MTQHYRFTPEVVYDYVEELDANLVCAICQSALVDPVTTTSCKHTFCRDCIERAISVNPQCPIDRSALTLHSLRETEQLVKLMLDELKVKCAAENCGVVMQRGLLLAHLRTCPMAVQMCEDGDCGLKMPKQRVSEHRAYECFQRKMECDRCGVLLTFKDQTERHGKSCPSGGTSHEALHHCILCGDHYDTSPALHQWSCPSARVPCTHTTRGCPAIISRSDLASHLKACPFEAMSSFFKANDARFKAMEEKQESLVREVTSLTSDLQVQRALEGTNGWRSLGSAHGGGTRRTAAVSNSTRPAQEPLSVDPASFNIPIPSLDTPITPRPHPHSPPQWSTSPTHHDISGSPPLPGITPRAAADFAASRSLFSPSFGSRQSYADWAFHHLTDPTPPTLVALEAVVGRLKRVVLQLAAGLDTMERRNEVRTMTESLRILEEVGALRAIVNTIRLQVMIDRPGSSRNSASFTTPPAPSSILIDPPPIPPPNDPLPSPQAGDIGLVSRLEDEDEVSVYESVVFSTEGINPSLSSSIIASSDARVHAWALQDISNRRARRDADAAGGIVGEPMGIPPTPPERANPMETNTGSSSTSRISRAVSNGLSSIRPGRRNTGTGPRL